MILVMSGHVSSVCLMRLGALQFGHSRQFCPVNFLKCNVQELCTRVVLWDFGQH
jgi:hypothetical protein